MKNSFTDLPTSRREFLRTSASGLGLLAFSSVAPAFLANSVRAGVPKPERDRSILVLIQLAGGNDGLNTLVPFEDDNYYRLRPNLALPKKDLHQLTDHLAFHPSCGDLAELFHEGKLAAIQNVGYPNPNRSHFRSMEIWETASRSDEFLSTGWIGRYFDNSCQGSPEEEPLGIGLGNDMPDVFLSANKSNVFSLESGPGRRRPVDRDLLAAMPDEEHLSEDNAGYLQHVCMNTLVAERRVLQRLQGYKPMASYPDSHLARSLQRVAALVASGQETRVYFVSHGGFDTHADQLQRHAALLADLSEAMAAFQADLQAHKLADQVLTMTFSEFGRRPSENVSGGTDHGTAAPLFVMGSRLRGSLFGSAPQLDLPKNKDLAYSTDFRAVYSSILANWFETDPEAVLGQQFGTVPFV